MKRKNKTSIVTGAAWGGLTTWLLPWPYSVAIAIVGAAGLGALIDLLCPHEHSWRQEEAFDNTYLSVCHCGEIRAPAAAEKPSPATK